MTVHVFGIRHHGPGSARSLAAAFDRLEPDAVLIEGPPDADALIPLVAEPGLEPPVAILSYAKNDVARAAHHPFARFSPEWQAMRWGVAHGARVRFIDLPMRHQLAMPAEPRGDAPSDPLSMIAEAAGHSDGERWWEHLVEERRDDEVFAAILEMMTALREELAAELGDGPLRERQREAFMRRCIRAEIKAGAERIAVVCGAWHAPSLSSLPAKRHDDELLRKVPRTPVQSTWVPWTQGASPSTAATAPGCVRPAGTTTSSAIATRSARVGSPAPRACFVASASTCRAPISSTPYASPRPSPACAIVRFPACWSTKRRSAA
jgi:Family of unknown function (DUF5682)